MKASDEIKAQRELLGEKVGRFEVTEMDVSEHRGAPFMVLSGKNERVVVRKDKRGWWVAFSGSLTNVGWLVDEDHMCAAETLARLLEKIREVAP